MQGGCPLVTLTVNLTQEWLERNEQRALEFERNTAPVSTHMLPVDDLMRQGMETQVGAVGACALVCVSWGRVQQLPLVNGLMRQGMEAQVGAVVECVRRCALAGGVCSSCSL